VVVVWCCVVLCGVVCGVWCVWYVCVVFMCGVCVCGVLRHMTLCVVCVVV
jgi:hypothetical protein